MADLEAVSERFRWFATHVFDGFSPLYTTLALAVADAAELLTLASNVKEGQPVPNLLFASVQYLLLGGIVHPLAEWYPSIGSQPRPPEGAFGPFQDFCRQHRDAIVGLLTTRLVQTNEVQRCTSWLPAFAYIAALAGQRPLTIVEAGTSAGLNLYWDRYAYDYGPGQRLGPPDAALTLPGELRGERRPALPERMPAVKARYGLDLHPIDVRDPDQARWLQALIWPEQARRRENLAAAIAVTQAEPPAVFAGDVLQTLPEVLHLIPLDQPVVVYHSFMANQLSPEGRDRLSALLAAEGTRRELYRLTMEWFGTPHPTLALTTYGGEPQVTVLAECDQHGHWLAWRAD